MPNRSIRWSTKLPLVLLIASLTGAAWAQLDGEGYWIIAPEPGAGAQAAPPVVVVPWSDPSHLEQVVVIPARVAVSLSGEERIFLQIAKDRAGSDACLYDDSCAIELEAVPADAPGPSLNPPEPPLGSRRHVIEF